MIASTAAPTTDTQDNQQLKIIARSHNEAEYDAAVKATSSPAPAPTLGLTDFALKMAAETSNAINGIRTDDTTFISRQLTDTYIENCLDAIKMTGLNYSGRKHETSDEYYQGNTATGDSGTLNVCISLHSKSHNGFAYYVARQGGGSGLPASGRLDELFYHFGLDPDDQEPGTIHILKTAGQFPKNRPYNGKQPLPDQPLNDSIILLEMDDLETSPENKIKLWPSQDYGSKSFILAAKKFTGIPINIMRLYTEFDYYLTSQVALGKLPTHPPIKKIRFDGFTTDLDEETLTIKRYPQKDFRQQEWSEKGQANKGHKRITFSPGYKNGISVGHDEIAPYNIQNILPEKSKVAILHILNGEKAVKIATSKGLHAISFIGGEGSMDEKLTPENVALILQAANDSQAIIAIQRDNDKVGKNGGTINVMFERLVKAGHDPSKIVFYIYKKHKADLVDYLEDGGDIQHLNNRITNQARNQAIEAKAKSDEQKAAIANMPPVTQGMELCPDHIWLTYKIPGPCQNYIDAVYEIIDTKDEKGNPKKKWIEKEGLTNQDKANACEHCYTNSVVRFNLLAKNIRHSHVGTFLPENNETKKLLERARYHLKKSDIDFTSNFILRRFHNKGEAESYFAFTPHNHKNGVTATAEAINHQLQELLPPHIYTQLIEAGFQIQIIDTSPYQPERNYLDNVCGRLVAEDGSILEISSFAKKGDLSTSVTIKGRKPRYPVLDEDGKPKIFGEKKKYTQTCEFVDYDYGTNKHKLALQKLPSTLVYDFGYSLTQKLIKSISKQEVDIEAKAVYSLTEGSSTIYVQDLHDFNQVKREYNKKRNNVIHNIAVGIATEKALKDISNVGKIFDTEYKSLIPGRGVSARYYSGEQATNSIPGLVFGDAAIQYMTKEISIAYQVTVDTAKLIYDKLEPIQRAHPNLLPEKVGLYNPNSTGLKDKFIYYPKTKVDKTKPPGA